MGLNGPEPTGAVHAYRVAMGSARATATVGQGAPADVMAALAGCDGVAAPLGAPDPRFIGRLAKPATLTLDFGSPITPQAGALPAGAPLAPPAGTPVLLLDGWVEYPYCQTNFAMWQAGVSAEAPSLDALDQPRRLGGACGAVRLLWACSASACSCCLLGCLQAAPRCACAPPWIFSWTEPRWHGSSLVQSWWCSRRRWQKLRAALLGTHSACRSRSAGPDYRYHTRAPLWDCRAQLGLYTQYGRCTPLLNETDDACAVFGPGEEVELRFGALPPPADGMHRTWVLDVHGWCKDMDRYTGQGAELSPMPTRHGSMSPQAQELQQQFNTRFAGGRP